MASSNPAVTLSVRISPEMRDQLEALSDATGRTKSFLTAEAIESYLALQAWQVKAVKSAIQKADGQDVQLIDHNKVSDWVNSWGEEGEQDKPK